MGDTPYLGVGNSYFLDEVLSEKAGFATYDMQRLFPRPDELRFPAKSLFCHPNVEDTL
jgi:hypothetical protein